MRLEKDSIGSLYIDDDAYYGIQSYRGAVNFNVIEQRINPDFVKNMARVKHAAAKVNYEIGALSKEKCAAIVKASQEIAEGKLYDAFIVDAIQGGAGTSSNMNANEVIANRAIELLGGKKGDYSIVIRVVMPKRPFSSIISLPYSCTVTPPTVRCPVAEAYLNSISPIIPWQLYSASASYACHLPWIIA